MFNKPVNRWFTVLAGAMGCASGAGMVATAALGVFTKSISTDFGWERSATTAGITCFYIASGIGSVVLGSILAKRSIRQVTSIFVALFALSIIGVSLLPPSLLLFCLLFSLMGFFGSGATAMPYAIAVAQQFDRNRGLALALVVTGSGLGAVTLPWLSSTLLATYGWRGGYIGVGLFAGIVALSGLILFFRDPPKSHQSQAETGASLSEVLRSGRTFWLIALSILGISIALVGVITNLVPILTDRGMGMAEAASLLGILGGASWVSRLGMGLLLDRMHARYVAAGIFLLAGIGVSLIAAGVSGSLLFVAAILIGLGIGAEADLLTFMVSRYFLFGSLSRALGAIWIFWAWGNGLGVAVGSSSYDLTGSYQYALYLYIALLAASFILILQLGPYRTAVQHDAA